jgi:signal transduction histidine kinase
MKGFALSSLRFRLMLLVLLAAVPASGLMLYAAVEDRQRETNLLEADTLRLVESISAEEKQLILGTRQLLILLAELPQIRDGDPSACSAFLSGLLGQYHRYSNFGAIEPDGDVFCSALPTDEPVNLADRGYFQRALQTYGFAIGDYQIGRITGKPSINFGYPVLNKAGQVEAVVFAALDLEWLNRCDYEIEALLPQDSTLTKIDREGVILVHEPDPEEWVGKYVQDVAFGQVVLNQGQGVVEAVDMDGRSRVYAFAPLSSTLYSRDLYVIIGVPKKLAFAEVNQVLVRNLSGLGLVTILALAAAWAFEHVFILRHVNTLLHATKKLGGGDLGTRTGPPYGPGELGQLGRAFDQMAQALEQSEAKRKLAEERMVRQERLAAIGQAAGGIAHDFRNILATIILYAQMPLSKGSLSPKVTQALEAVLHEARRAADMVQQVLDFSRRSPIKTQPMGLKSFMGEMVDTLQPTLPENIRLVVNAGSDEYKVSADPTRIHQTLMNLVVNARDAMPEGGELRIELSSIWVEPDKPPPTAEMSAGQWVCVSVSDTGVGIPPEVMSHLFEPFFTTKASGKGTGLGLAQVYGIVKQHGGSIGVETEVGRGTTFNIYLPAKVNGGND